MAPAGPGAALLGSGPGAVRSLLPWDSAETAALLLESGPLPAPLAARLAGFDAAIVYSRAGALPARLKRLIPRVVVRDPQPPSQATHASAWFATALEDLGVPPASEPPPPMAPSPKEAAAARDLARNLPERFLAVHPGSGSPAKNWAADRFAALADLLVPGLPFALVEGPADREAVAGVQALAPRAVVVRDLPLRILGALLARAGFYVGNDSGISHLAAAYGAPSLVLFGPTDPAVWSPLGPRVAFVRSPAA